MLVGAANQYSIGVDTLSCIGCRPAQLPTFRRLDGSDGPIAVRKNDPRKLAVTGVYADLAVVKKKGHAKPLLHARREERTRCSV